MIVDEALVFPGVILVRLAVLVEHSEIDLAVFSLMPELATVVAALNCALRSR